MRQQHRNIHHLQHILQHKHNQENLIPNKLSIQKLHILQNHQVVALKHKTKQNLHLHMLCIHKKILQPHLEHIHMLHMIELIPLQNLLNNHQIIFMCAPHLHLPLPLLLILTLLLQAGHLTNILLIPPPNHNLTKNMKHIHLKFNINLLILQHELFEHNICILKNQLQMQNLQEQICILQLQILLKKL